MGIPDACMPNNQDFNVFEIEFLTAVPMSNSSPEM
jgi:hypothetical protein